LKSDNSDDHWSAHGKFLPGTHKIMHGSDANERRKLDIRLITHLLTRRDGQMPKGERAGVWGDVVIDYGA
jgi:hypothetical protein